MARRGTFGRQPRPAQSLTNTIIAIARQAESQKDQNIMEAWQKGGEFEGHKVTDEEVLAHWRQRLTEVASDDPMYDVFKDSLMETDYTIHESKVTAHYAQLTNPTSADDRAVANFYLGWAKKVPKDSEFYRTLQRDAGQFMRSAAARGRVSNSQAIEKKYQSDMQVLHDKHEAAGEYIIDTLTRMAQGSRGWSVPQLIAGGQTLLDFDATDPQGLLKLLDSIDPTTNERSRGTPGSKNVLFYGDDQKPVTGADILAKFQKLGGGGGEQLDLSAVKSAIRAKQDGLQQRIDLATKTGHASDVTKLRGEYAQNAELGRQVDAYPVEVAYMDRREQHLAIMNDKNASAYMKRQEVLNYRADLAKMSLDPRIQTNDRYVGALRGEANGDESVINLKDSFTGQVQHDGTSAGSKDIKNDTDTLETAELQIKAVEAGSAVWTTGDVKDGVFHPAAGGSVIGAATNSDIAAASGGVQPRIMYVPDSSGTPQRVLVMGQDIMATGIDPTTGEKLVGQNLPVAQAFVIGGKVQIAYRENGVTVYSDLSNPPWDPNLARLVPTSTGFELDLTNAAKAAIDSGQVNATTGFLYKQIGGKSVLTVDPSVAPFASDPAHYKSGIDRGTDFGSLSLSLLNATDEGRRVLRNLDNDPGFKMQIDHDLHLSAGFTEDPNSPDGYSGGDYAKYAASSRQLEGIINPALTGDDRWKDTIGQWDRSEPVGPNLPASMTQGNDTYGNYAPFANPRLANTGWAALGQAFVPGTLNLRPPDAQATGSNITTTGLNIRVPGVGGAPAQPQQLYSLTTPKPITPAPTPPIKPENVGTDTTSAAGGSWNYGGGNQSFNPSSPTPSRGGAGGRVPL